MYHKLCILGKTDDQGESQQRWSVAFACSRMLRRGVARVLLPDKCASSEGWHEQWVKVPPG